MSPDALKAREYLEQFLYFDNEIEQNLREQERLRTLAEGCRAMNITERVQSSSSGDSMERAIISITEKQEELIKMYDELLNKSDEMLKIVNKMEDSANRMIIMYKYRSRMKLWQIGDLIGMSEIAVKKRHPKALDEFGKLLKVYTTLY